MAQRLTEDLGFGITRIDAGYVKPGLACFYLLESAEEFAVIETGTVHSVATLEQELQSRGIDNDQVRFVIPTHVHLDHAGGAGEMMRQFDQASLIIHPRGAKHMIDPQKLIAGTIAVYGEDRFRQLYGSIEPIPEARIRVAQDLDRFDLGERELVFFDTPGHARHHFCIYDEVSQGVFTGDTFGLSYEPMKRLSRGLIPTTGAAEDVGVPLSTRNIENTVVVSDGETVVVGGLISDDYDDVVAKVKSVITEE